MTVLGIDTSSAAASAAVCRIENSGAATVLASCYANIEAVHSKTLMPMLENMLKTLFEEEPPIPIDKIAVSTGPGSFTGLRIALSAAKGLAFALDIPIAPVSTLYSLALNSISFNGIVCPVLNARRGQFYNALFRISDSTVTRLCPDRAIAGQELIQELKAYSEPVILSGDGAHLFDGFRTAPPLLQFQNAVSVCLASGEGKPIHEVMPDYLRPVRIG